MRSGIARTLLLMLVSMQGLSPAGGETGDAIPRTSVAENPAELGIGRGVPDLRLVPLTGEPIMLADVRTPGARPAEHRGTVVAFTSTTCPLSARYAPRLAAIEEEFRERGVSFVFVNGVEAETETEMREQIRASGFDGPYLADRDRAVARALGARTTTEVFLLNADRVLVYRGAVDDQFGIGSALPRPRHEFLREAIEAALTGRDPKHSATWPPGCLIDLPEAPEDLVPAEVTYHGSVARILMHRCVSCHQRDGAGPFALDTYESVRGRASMIEAVVRDGLMPPWPLSARGDDEPSPWRHDRSLSERERRDLLAWLRAGRPKGTPEHLEPVPARADGWTIGVPDRIFIASLPLPAEGPMQHLRVVVPTHLEAGEWVEAIEFRPVKRDTVHRAIVWLLEPGGVLPAPDEVPRTLSLLAVYSPGCEPVIHNRGSMPRLAPGSILIVDLYARPMGQAMKSALRMAMRFSASPPHSPPAMQARSLVLRADRLAIPAGAARAVNTFEASLNQETSLRAITPITGARGRQVSIQAVQPGSGEPLLLLDAPNFDHRWLMRFELQEPVLLPAGTRLIVSGVFDNSAANPNVPDPQTAPRTGPGADEEALIVALEIEEPAGDSRDGPP